MPLGLLEALHRLRVVEHLRCDLDGGRTRTRLDHAAQGLLLEVRLALHGLDQVGDQVGATLVLVKDLGPGGFRLFVQALEVVVTATGQRERGGECQDDGEVAAKGCEHGVLRVMLWL